jgi:hypothetical protein
MVNPGNREIGVYILAERSREDAERTLSQRHFFFPLRLWKKKKKPAPLKRVELIYLPFYVFAVVTPGEEKKQKVSITLDGLLGDNLFFFRENMQYVSGVDHPVCPFVLSLPGAQTRVKEKHRWLQMEYRSRMKQKAAVYEILEGKRIFYPFWVGYFQVGGAFTLRKYDFKLMDGVSGEVQGVRMRKVFLKALRYL